MEFLKGGMFRGNRTYILGALVAVQAVAEFLVGDINLTEFLEQVPQILAGLGFMTLRAAIPGE